jgi:hypothetical protein
VFRQVEQAIAHSTALDLAPGRSPGLQLTGSFRRGASSKLSLQSHTHSFTVGQQQVLIDQSTWGRRTRKTAR